MILTLQRKPSLFKTTLGKLLIDGSFVCFTLEDQVREVAGQPVSAWKVPGETAIPAGVYRVTLVDSPRFGPGTLSLVDVPGFVGVRMHAGNSAEDTEGCLLLGMQATDRSLVGGSSRPAVELVKGRVQQALQSGAVVTIDIRNA